MNRFSILSSNATRRPREDLHEEDATNSAVDLDRRDTIDEGCDKPTASTRDGADIEESRISTHVGVGPHGANVEVLRGGLEEGSERMIRAPYITLQLCLLA